MSRWNRRAALVVVLAVASLLPLLLRTGLADTGAIRTRAAEPSQAAHVRSGGCGRAAAPGTVTLRPGAAGQTRRVLVHVPTGYRPDDPVPLVLDLHGSASTPAQQRVRSRMDATADAHGFLVAYPEGSRDSPPGYSWAVPATVGGTLPGRQARTPGPAAGPTTTRSTTARLRTAAPAAVPTTGGRLGDPAPTAGIDRRPVSATSASVVAAPTAGEVGYLDALVGQLRQRYCVAPDRVYATGFSGGARMTSALGCQPEQVFAALATVGGLRAPLSCPSGRTVSVIAVHGTADKINPYAGHGSAYWTYSVPQAAARWAALDGCRPRPVGTAPYPGVIVERYGGCRAGATVTLYSLAGVGHTWPKARDGFDVNEVIWAFFAAHPMA